MMCGKSPVSYWIRLRHEVAHQVRTARTRANNTDPDLPVAVCQMH